MSCLQEYLPSIIFSHPCQHQFCGYCLADHFNFDVQGQYGCCPVMSCQKMMDTATLSRFKVFMAELNDENNKENKKNKVKRWINLEDQAKNSCKKQNKIEESITSCSYCGRNYLSSWIFLNVCTHKLCKYCIEAKNSILQGDYTNAHCPMKDCGMNIDAEMLFIFLGLLANSDNSNNKTLSHELEYNKNIKVNINTSRKNEEKEQKKCIVCEEANRDVIFYKCGHICCCNECAQTKIKGICPICRSDIKEINKFYVA